MPEVERPPRGIGQAVEQRLEGELEGVDVGRILGPPRPHERGDVHAGLPEGRH